MNETLTNAATALLAERDGIHPAHAANRLALAIRVVEAAERVADRDRIEGDARTAVEVISRALGDNPCRFPRVYRSSLADRPLSDSTLRVALLIAEAAQ